MDASYQQQKPPSAEETTEEESDWALVQPDDFDQTDERPSRVAFFRTWTFWICLAGPFIAICQWLRRMLTFGCCGSFSAQIESMRQVEDQLMEFSSRYGNAKNYQIRSFDTPIPRTVVPLQSHDFDIYEENTARNYTYLMHATHATNSSAPNNTPLVFLHGYLNASSYFYRNIAGLSQRFASIYSVDVLGAGLSSRPRFDIAEGFSAEDFFVESLEAWRKANAIDKFILLGHSIGGLISIAYAERYPQYVQHLVLISPAGVQADPYSQQEREFYFQSTFCCCLQWRRYQLMHWVFQHYTIGSLYRSVMVPLRRVAVRNYVKGRLAVLTERTDEYEAFVEYLYHNLSLPGSAEYCLQHFLTPFTYPQRPMVDRIPNLKVSDVTFVYGDEDWMDPAGGYEVLTLCGCSSSSSSPSNAATTAVSPKVQLYTVHWSGHYLMLENFQEFNAAVVLALLNNEQDNDDDDDDDNDDMMRPLVYNANHPPPPVPFHAIPSLLRNLRFPRGMNDNGNQQQ